MTAVDWVRRRWVTIDWIIAAYTTWMGLLIVWFSANVEPWFELVAVHVAIVTILLIIPPRGSAWERREWPSWVIRGVHHFVRFVRYAYPLLLMLFFFEEGRFTVNMIFPETPYWFEPWIYEADLAVFGELPIRIMNGWVHPLLTEVMNFFYWSYYIILIGGVVVGYRGLQKSDKDQVTPAPGFEEVITSLGLAFILAFLLYPWLAARGPWENPQLMAEMTPLHGYFFTRVMEFIIEHGAVSGNCLPSGHVAGAWAIVFGLSWTPGNRKAAYVFGFLAVGMTIACVYTRYHHAVDMPAGFVCGALGAWIGGSLVRRRTGFSGNTMG